MAVKVSAAMRERLLGQKKRMDSSGPLIENKSLTKMRLRVLPPREGELPGVEYHSFFSKPLNKGVSSLRCWGLPCPVSDALDRIYNSGTAEEKEFAKSFVRRSTEYWIAVIDRADEGTPEAPRVRVLRGKQSLYQQLVSMLLDEDVGEDVTDAKAGCDLLVKKEGQQLDTVWTLHKLDHGPISEDKDMAKAWVALAQTFDVRSKFFPPKLDTLLAIYEGLTGDSEFPDAYAEAIEAVKEGNLEGLDAVVSDNEGEEAEVEGEGEEEAEGEDDLIGQMVTFENEGVEYAAVVAGYDEEDASYAILDVEDQEDQWSVAISELTVVVEEEEEPEPVAPVIKKTVKKTVKKPAAKPVTKPAGAPHGSKTTKTTAGAKGLPAKPKSAAASIKDRLKGK